MVMEAFAATLQSFPPPSGNNCLSLSAFLSTARIPLVEVLLPWVSWDRPGSGFESLSEGGTQGLDTILLQNTLSSTYFSVCLNNGEVIFLHTPKYLVVCFQK